MNRAAFRCVSLFGIALSLCATQRAVGGIIYVALTNGDVYRYDNMAQAAAQTATTITGTKVRDNATAPGNYSNDQGATVDLSTGIVYRIANGGNVFSYPSVEDYLGGTNQMNLTSGLNPYSTSNNKRINGMSYDGNTGGFYAVGAGSNSMWPGDIITFNTLAAFLAAAPDSVSPAGYNGNVVNFYDFDTYPGTTVGNVNFPSKNIEAQYFQVAGNGRLEGFESIADYVATAANRINVTDVGAFGGGANETNFQATAAFVVPAPMIIPEPASLLLCLGAAFTLIVVSRRR